ncbi:flagellin [Ruegeria arenilitoris]|uniref:flagellin n=1 Tax=Ruegeria arenilitoris TaxID=1173585 RepID=UPI0020C30ED7|nr:flagellin [Ruegeria arenilitoris]
MMKLNSIGDMARSMTVRARSVQIRNQLDTLTYEMQWGRVRNVSEHLGGDYSQLLDLDRSLSRLDAYRVATSEARLFTDAMQLSLNVVGDSIGKVSATLLSFGTANQTVTHDQASVQAREELDTMMSALNKRVGGRSLFSGIAADVSPLASPESLLAALRAEMVGQPTISAMRQAAEDWFNDPAGFETVIYRGSNTKLTPMQISENERINLPITANDTQFRTAMRDVAIAALVSDPALNIAPDAKTALFRQLGVDLADNEADNIKLQARVGTAEERIEQAATRNAAARTSLEISKNNLIAADPESTATQLKAVQFQLESLYTVTVRNSTLSLVNFLR